MLQVRPKWQQDRGYFETRFQPDCLPDLAVRHGLTRRLYSAQVILRPHAECPQSIDQRYTQCVGYLLAYCTAVAELAGGAPTLDAAATQELIARMERYRPNAPLSFMISLSAPAVTAEMRADHAPETAA